MRVFLSCLLLVLIVATGCQQSQDAPPEQIRVQDLLIPLTLQQTETRQWADITITEAARFEGEDAFFLYNPLLLRGTPEGDLFVGDYGDMIIKQFDHTGSPIQRYGGGRGVGPDEFANPTDMTIAENGDLWVVDGQAKRLVRFNAAGSLLSSSQAESFFHRLALLDDGSYYSMGFSFSTGMLFHYYAASDSLLHSFGELVEDQGQKFISLDGWIAPIGNDLLYSPLRYDFIVRYNQAGEVVYAVTAIEHNLEEIPDVEVESIQGGQVFKPSGSPRKTQLSLSGDHFYVTSFPASEAAGQTVIDVYNTADGQYRYSFKLPESTSRHVHIAGDYAFTTVDTSAVIYYLAFD